MIFLCHGNIIRSPMAEALLRRAIGTSKVSVSSAGLHAHAGRQADERARSLAGEFGVSLNGHVARPITSDLIHEADLILVMDGLNEAELLGRYPQAAPKVFLLGTWLGNGRFQQREIFDPYDGDEGDVRRCIGLLQDAVSNLTADLFS